MVDITCPELPTDDEGNEVRDGGTYIIESKGSPPAKVVVFTDPATMDLYFRKVHSDRSQRLDEVDPDATWRRV